MYKLQRMDNHTEILLYSLITDGMTANQVISQLPPEGPITLRINSDGGDVFEAIGLYNYLRDREVYVVIDGICASAASIVAMCGKRITMRNGSMMMLHRPLSMALGNADDLREAAAVLDKITESITDIYAARSQSLTREVIAELMSGDTWMTAGECFVKGFCDEVESVIEDSLPAKTYEDGVHDERQRLYALDELSGPGREGILMAAKYKTLRTAQDVAIELLKAERVKSPSVSAFGAGEYDGAVSMMVAAINEKRR